ncbi:MAG: hypothetical protein WCP30_08330 [Mycobacteriaceae bacterium]
MGYPMPPSWPPPPASTPPPRNAGDVTGSVVVMVVTVLVVGAGAFMGLFSVAFLDHCPPATCSAEGAVTASMTAVVVAALVAVAGIITTIVRLATRKTAWPFAIGTLGLCVGVFVLGAIAYTAAVS